MLLNWLARAIVRPTVKSTVVASTACLTLATVLRIAIDPLLPRGVPYFTFWLAVDAATIWAGWPAGAVTMIIGAIIGWWAWLPPAFSFPADRPSIAVVVTFLVLGAAQVALMHLTRVALMRMRAHDHARQLLVQELAHRLRNIFTVTDAVVQQTLRSSDDLEQAKFAIRGRMSALSSALAVATAEHGATPLRSVVERVVGPLAPSPLSVRFSGPEYSLQPDAVTSIALVLHELATNATKHGAWNHHDGTVDISWERSDQTLFLRWKETGSHQPKDQERRGFGTQLIERAIPDAVVERRREGATYTVEIAAPHREIEAKLPHPAYLAANLTQR